MRKRERVCTSICKRLRPFPETTTPNPDGVITHSKFDLPNSFEPFIDLRKHLKMI